MGDVFDLLEHIGEHPSDYMILAAVHLEKRSKTISENSAAELVSVMGPAQPLPDYLREKMRWAGEQAAKLNRSQGNAK